MLHSVLDCEDSVCRPHNPYMIEEYGSACKYICNREKC